MTDLAHFKSWFSGFVDGEGCFSFTASTLRPIRRSWTACLDILLRADDDEILKSIESIFGGSVVYRPVGPGQKPGAHPACRWRASSIKDCLALVEQFNDYPLLAKKQRDFVIWEKGVNHLAMNRGKPNVTDSSTVDHLYMNGLIDELKAIRKYAGPVESLQLVS